MLHHAPKLKALMDPVKIFFQFLHRLGHVGLLVTVQRHRDRTGNSLSPNDRGQAETATKLRLKMAYRPNIALIQEDRGADARHDGADSKRSRTFGSDYAP